MDKSTKNDEMPPLVKIAASAADYSHVVVNLHGVNGNAIVVAGTVRKALKKAGAPPEVCQVFWDEALSGDYDHVIQTCMDWVTIEMNPGCDCDH